MYLWAINVAVAAAVAAVSLSTVLFYLTTTIVPVGFPYCPFKTPQSVYANDVLNAIVEHHTFLGQLVSVWKEQVKGLVHRPKKHDSSLPTQANGRSERERAAGGFFAAGKLVERAWNAVTNRFPSHTSSSDQAFSLEGTPQPKSEQTPDGTHLTEVEKIFVKDSLTWLIEHSQNSASIDIAVGALAISGIWLEIKDVETRPNPRQNIEDRINSHLIKRFSDCFVANQIGTELHLVQTNMMEQVLDYARWMSHFSSDSQSMMNLVFSVAKSLGIELVTHLGLSFAR